MEPAVLLLIVILLIVFLRCRRLSKEIETKERIFVEDIEAEAWKHESNLKLLQKAVKNRITSLDSHAKMLDSIAKDKIDTANENIARIRKTCNEKVEEATRYKLWKFCVKTGAESMSHPDRLVVIADTKEAAITLVQKKFDLDSVTDIYDIIQSRRNKNEILLESYDIL